MYTEQNFGFDILPSVYSQQFTNAKDYFVIQYLSGNRCYACFGKNKLFFNMFGVVKTLLCYFSMTQLFKTMHFFHQKVCSTLPVSKNVNSIFQIRMFSSVLSRHSSHLAWPQLTAAPLFSNLILHTYFFLYHHRKRQRNPKRLGKQKVGWDLPPTKSKSI